MVQINKFNQFCESVLEDTSKTLIEARGKTYYTVAPTADREGLIGYESLVANFTDEKPATAEEIIDVIQRNSEEPDNHHAAVAVFRELIDSNFLSQSASPEKVEGDLDQEPTPDELKDEPEVPSKKEEKDEIEDDDGDNEISSPIPPPEEDEEDTFERDEEPALLGKDEEEEEENDIPASHLLKKEREKKVNRSSQMLKLINNLLKRRGKSDEDIQKYLNHYQQKGLV